MLRYLPRSLLVTTAATLVAAVVTPRASLGAEPDGELDVRVRDDVTPVIVARVEAGATGLRARDFILRLAAAGESRPMTLEASSVQRFRESADPLELAILVQDSLLPEPEVIEAVAVIAEARDHDTAVTLLVFGTTVQTVMSQGTPGSVRAAATEAARGLKARAPARAVALDGGSLGADPGLTRGVVAAAEGLARRPGRRVLFVIGDGRDDASGAAATAAAVQLEGAEIETHVLAFAPEGLSGERTRRIATLAARRNRAAVRLLVQLPQVAAVHRADVNDIYTAEFLVPPELRSAVFDGRRRSVQVFIRGREGQSVDHVFAPRTRSPAPGGGGVLRWSALALAGAGALGLAAALWSRARRRRRRATSPSAPQLIAATGAAAGPAAREALTACPVATARPVTQLLHLEGSGGMPPDAKGPAPKAPTARSASVSPAALPGEPQGVAYLVALAGPTPHRSYRLLQGRNIIGRARDCEVQLDDPFVSSHHAALLASGGTFTIFDTGSRGGVLIGTAPVRHGQIADQDTFQCGQTVLQLRVGTKGGTDPRGGSVG